MSNPVNMIQKFNPEDFLPASNEEKQSLVVMRESVSFWKDGVRRLLKNKIAMVRRVLTRAKNYFRIFLGQTNWDVIMRSV